MRRVLFVMAALLPALLLSRSAVHADGSWLDTALQQWNAPGMAVPVAPPRALAVDPQCDPTARSVELADDQQVVNAGWTLVGPYRGGWGVTIITGASGYDGMCRPLGYQVFVFVDHAFAGTLSPVLMDSRTDGAIGQVQLFLGGTGIAADFSRYSDTDPLCCPSRTSSVSYTVDKTAGAAVVTATGVSTSSNTGQ